MTGGWQPGRPPVPGYYLGAWKRGGRWVVSELWFNQDSAGSGWWSSRGYLEGTGRTAVQVEVKAWMPVPEYGGEPVPGEEA
jgi:hypothetical protein